MAMADGQLLMRPFQFQSPVIMTNFISRQQFDITTIPLGEACTVVAVAKKIIYHVYGNGDHLTTRWTALKNLNGYVFAWGGSATFVGLRHGKVVIPSEYIQPLIVDFLVPLFSVGSYEESLVNQMAKRALMLVSSDVARFHSKETESASIAEEVSGDEENEDKKD